MRRDATPPYVTELETATGEVPGAGAIVLEAGARIGRFVVRKVIGYGGMGVVFGAHDPDLDREVAIKLLQPGRAGGAAAAPERMLREARALARVAHPNVLAVHEVGMFGVQVFLAMELATGGTLRTWCQTPRPWREVRALYLQACRGLEAAHRAGLVHRDVKPENLLLGADGRVRVADFGLVGTVEARAMEAPAGTPAYMAPEQHAGGEVGPAADQFALCVSLWEALHGRRPFAGGGAALVAAIEAGAIEAPPADRPVPAWLQAVVRRGLAARPDARWPSMSALLAALEHDPDALRRRRLAIGGGVAAAVALLAVTAFALTRSARAPAPCRGLERPLAGVWDAPRAAAVREAFARTGRAYAADTFDRVAGRLDTYARGWVAARIEACEATHVRGERSPALLDRRMACLDRRLVDLDALVGVLASHPTADVLDRAVTSATKLPPLAACDDLAALEAAVAPPADPAIRAEVAAVRRAVADAAALANTGQVREALPIAQAAATAAARTDYPPVIGEALLRRGLLEAATGDAPAAGATLEAAMLAAAGAHDDALAARIWTERLFVIGVLQAQPEDALRLHSAAEAAVARAGGDELLAANLEHNLANLLAAHHRNGEAVPHFERAIAAKERAYGVDHPAVATSLNGLGVALEQLGRPDDALVPLRRALAIWEASFGPDHPDVAGALNNLGNVLQRRDSYDDAIDALTRSLAIRERALGPRHPTVADSHDNVALALEGLDRLDEARAHQEVALAIRIETLGPDHYDVGISLHNIGGLLEHQGAHAEALAYQQRALAIWERTLGPDHTDLGYPLTGIASAELALGHAEAAHAAATRAVALRADPDVPVEDRALSRFVLARVLWELGRDRPHALALAREARAALAEADASEAVAEADAWLAARTRPGARRDARLVPR